MAEGEATPHISGAPGVSFVDRWSAALGLLMTAFMWATMVPFVAALLPFFDPYLLSVLRYGLALPLLVALVLVLERQNPFNHRAGWGRLFVLGGAMAGFSTFYTLGILYSNPLTAAVVLSVNPIVAALLTRVMIGTRLSPSVIIAIVLSVVGALLVVRGGPGGGVSEVFGFQLGFQGGELLLILAVTCWSWYSLKVQSWFPDLTNLRVTTLTAGTAVIWLGAVYVLFVFTGLARPFGDMPGFGPISMLLWLSWGAAAVAIVFWHHGVGRLGVPVATLYINLIPVFAFVLSAFMFNITPNAYQIVGGLIVLTGVVQVQVLRLRQSRAG